MNNTPVFDDIYKALASFATELGYDSDHTVRADQNDVPLPDFPFVVFTVDRNDKLATNEHLYTTQKDETGKVITLNDALSTQIELKVKADFYGDSAFDKCMVCEQIFRDFWGIELFEESGIIPLYADEGQREFYVGQADEFQQRWSTTLYFNYISTVSKTQDFFDTAKIDVIRES